jgi:hypothetical protein
MEWFTTWFMEAPYEHTFLILAAANTIAQKTPWKGDDDVLAVIGEVITTVVTGRRKTVK